MKPPPVRKPRHALECELTPLAPDTDTRAAMREFYRTNEGYTRQQASHGPSYFSRWLSVLDRALGQGPVSLLEIGAGSSGAIREFLRFRPNARAVALELSAASFGPSAEPGSRSLRGVAGDALRLPFQNRSVDACVAFEVIEHLPDVALALDEMLRVVRRPGWVIIGLPNHASLWTPFEDGLFRRNRLAFGVEGGRGAWRWWRRNVRLAWRKRILGRSEFLYRQPILEAVQGGDADAVYYAAPTDLMRFFRNRGARLVTTSAAVRFGIAGRFIPVELQGSTVMAWRVT